MNNNCNSCYSCYFCYSCYSCYFCYSCYSCNFCYSCYSCNSCNSCNSCYYSYGLRMSENMIFCLGGGRWEPRGEGYQKNHRAWNKDVSGDRFEQIRDTVREILKGWQPEWQGSTRKKEWSKVTPQQWKKLSEIPEFDLEVTKGITGLEEIPMNTETININGKDYTMSELSSLLPKS